MFLKKTFLAVLFISTCFFAQAQFEKGSILFGAGMDYSIGPSISGATIETSVGTLDFGYFVKDRFAVGLGLNIKNGFGLKYSLLDYNADVFGRYYFLKKRRVSFYGEVFAGFGQHIYQNSTDVNVNAPRMNLGLAMGMDIRITKQIGLDFGLRYTANKYFDRSEAYGNRLSAKVGLKLNLPGWKK